MYSINQVTASTPKCHLNPKGKDEFLSDKEIVKVGSDPARHLQQGG